MKSRIMTTFILLVLAVFPSCNKNTENFPIIPFGVSADYNGSRRINSESVYAQLQTGSMGSFVYFEAYDSADNFMEFQIFNYRTLGTSAVPSGTVSIYYFSNYGATMDTVRSGQLTIVEYTDTTVGGTFNFITASGLVVSNGSFNVNYQ